MNIGIIASRIDTIKEDKLILSRERGNEKWEKLNGMFKDF